MNPNSGASQTKNANRLIVFRWSGRLPARNSSASFRVKFEVTTRNGPQMMYKFEDGTTLWGSYVRDQKLAEVQPGVIVFIQLHRKRCDEQQRVVQNVRCTID
jgi:hypothetical protein